jgi:hypothetical protein
MPSRLIQIALLFFATVALAGSSGPPSMEFAPVPWYALDAATPPIVTVGDGTRRFELLPTLEWHQLCAWEKPSVKTPWGEAGWTAMVPQGDCAIEVDVTRISVAFGGSRDTLVEWAGVLGLAERKVERVVLEFADGTRTELPLAEWPRTPWLSYSYNFHGRPFPQRVLTYGSADELLSEVEVSDWIRPYCLVEEMCARDSERDPGAWMIAASNGEDLPHLPFGRATARRTYDLVSGSTALRAILGGRRYRVEDLGLWRTCDWRRPLGTWARVRLAKRAAVEADWPFVRLTKDGNFYTKHHQRRAIARLASLLVIVDKRGRLVAVEPEEIASESPIRFDHRIVNTTTSPGAHLTGQTDCNLDY